MADQNSPLADILSRRPSFWRRFRSAFIGPQSAYTARQEAEDAWWVPAWFAFGYSSAALAALGRGGPSFALVPIFFILVGIILAVVISKEQARWAITLTLIWTIFECVKTAIPLARGMMELAFPLDVVLVFVAARSLRASSRFIAMQRKTVPAADVFN